MSEECWLAEGPFYFLAPLLGNVPDFAAAFSGWLSVETVNSCPRLQAHLAEVQQAMLALENRFDHCFLQEVLDDLQLECERSLHWRKIGVVARELELEEELARVPEPACAGPVWRGLRLLVQDWEDGFLADEQLEGRLEEEVQRTLGLRQGYAASYVDGWTVRGRWLDRHLQERLQQRLAALGLVKQSALAEDWDRLDEAMENLANAERQLARLRKVA